MPRLFLPAIQDNPEKIEISGEDARYLLNVLRLNKGDGLVIFDSIGHQYTAVILSAGRGTAVLAINGKLEAIKEPETKITLIQGILKGQKMDLVIQKATELGASSIVPLNCKRSQVKDTRKLQRWRKIAQEASRQSGRAHVPDIQDESTMEDLIMRYGMFNGIVLYESGGMDMQDACKSIIGSDCAYLAVGPEGGFDAGEIEFASKHGLVPVNFGQRIMRAETAAIAGLAIMQYVLGNAR